MLEYKEFAKYYDLLYSNLEYDKDVKRIIELVSEYKESNGNELLDVACGTGTHINYLKSKFNCTGIDLNESMLNEARKKNIGNKFEIGNMKSFNLNKEFDVVTCLFNSMNYLENNTELKETITNFYNHLKKGGITIMELLDEDFAKKLNHLRTYDGEDIKIARIGEIELKGDFFDFNLHYMISKKGEEIIKAEDTHKCRRFPKEDILSTMKETGFQTKYIKKGFYDKGLFIGIKI